MRATIQGLQQAQRANLRILQAVKPSGGLGRAVQWATAQGYRYAVYVTHVASGALKASHRTRLESGGRRGRIFIDPGAINPRGQRPAVYGPIEERRGGSHAFYGRTAREAGPRIGRGAVSMILRELP